MACSRSPAPPSALATAPSTIALRAAIDLHKKGEYETVEALLQQALVEAPNDVNLWSTRGVNLRVMKRPHQAVACFRRALAIADDQPAVWSNLGNALKDLKHVESAIACHRRAIALSPADAGAHYNLGLALTLANRHVEALTVLDRAVALAPRNPRVRWDRSRTYLYLGDYARGWPEYEVRLVTGRLPKRAAPGARWRGERYDGKRLLIVSEQGFGDAIWIARYLRQVKALGGELIMECRPALIPLIESMGIVDRLVPKADPLPDADLHLYQCSLPGMYTPTLAAVPSSPYLAADPARLAKFAAPLERGRGKLKVGIVWSGSTTFGANHDRAVSLRLFLQWFALPDVQLYSLQKGPPEAELKALPAGAPIIDLSPAIGDFADTAAAIAHLDLVLMTDSAVAHLAGALGKPVWVLVNYVPHWLWLFDRPDSPWYPSLRLFRPCGWSDWNDVFDQAAAELLTWSTSAMRRKTR